MAWHGRNPRVWRPEVSEGERSVRAGRGMDTQGRHGRKSWGSPYTGGGLNGVYTIQQSCPPWTPPVRRPQPWRVRLWPPLPHLHEPPDKPAFLGFILFQREAIPGPRRALTWAPRVCIHSWGERRPHRRGLRDGHGDQGLRSLSAACRGADTCYVSEFSGLGPRHPAAALPSPRPSS